MEVSFITADLMVGTVGSDAFKFKPNDAILTIKMLESEVGESIIEVNPINDFLFYYEERP